MTRRFCLLLLAAGTVAFHLFCSHAPVSGPSTEEGNPQIVAVVVDSLNKPVQGVAITAYSLDPSIEALQIPSEAATELAHGVTNTLGECSFDSLPAGTYSIEANDYSSNRRAFKSRITIYESAIDSVLTDTLILERPCAFRGVVTRGGYFSNQQLQDAGIMVIIQELPKSTLTRSSGTYDFTGLPAGTYTIIYYATDGFISARRSVNINAGDTAVVDTVFLKPSKLIPPKGFTASYDTIANLVRLTWQKVNYDSLRWYEVLRYDLTGPYDDTLRTTDTTVVDSVDIVPAGTVLTYVVRSVSRALTPSENAGPIEIVAK